MELLRRLLLILFTLAAVSTMVAPSATLYSIAKPDFQRELDRHPYSWKHKNQSLGDYIAEETKDRVLVVTDGQWMAIADAVESQSRGYIKPGMPQLQKVIPHFVYQLKMLYLVSDAGQGNNYRRIRQLTPRDYKFNDAPYFYKHPYSPWSPILLIAGILCYMLLPRHRFTKNTLCYGAGFSAVIGPDIVALMMVTGFYVLGLMVGMSAAAGGILTLFSSNLILITMGLWAFTLFGFYMFRIAARYAGLGLHCSNGYLTRFSPSGTERLSLGQIRSAELGAWSPSKWLIRFGFIISILNWRAMGPTLLSASRNDPQLEIHLESGKVWRFTLTGAQNVEQVLLCLEKNGVTLDSALRKMLSKYKQ